MAVSYAESIKPFYSSGYAELTEAEIEAREKYGIELEFPVSYETDVDLMELDDKYTWDIRYYFSGNIREHIMPSGRSYGGKSMTFRRLFLILVAMNNGVDFIQEYINKELPYSYPGERLREFLDYSMDVAESRFAQELVTLRRTKRGKVDRRQRGKLKALADYSASIDTEVAEMGEEVSRIIKEDIEARFITGQMQFNPSGLSLATQNRREWAGLLKEPRYYASGQFINDLHIICKLEKKEWLTDINILE